MFPLPQEDLKAILQELVNLSRVLNTQLQTARNLLAEDGAQSWLLRCKSGLSLSLACVALGKISHLFGMQVCTCKIQTIMTSSSLGNTQFSSVAQSCLTLGDLMDCSTPGLPVHPPTPGVYSNSCPLNR